MRARSRHSSMSLVFHHMWAEPKKMDGRDLLRWPALGAIPAALLALTQEPSVKDRLLKNTEANAASGTFGNPTFFVGNAIFFRQQGSAARRRRRDPGLRLQPRSNTPKILACRDHNDRSVSMAMLPALCLRAGRSCFPC
jgi:hypothetical protein